MFQKKTGDKLENKIGNADVSVKVDKDEHTDRRDQNHYDHDDYREQVEIETGYPEDESGPRLPVSRGWSDGIRTCDPLLPKRSPAIFGIFHNVALSFWHRGLGPFWPAPDVFYFSGHFPPKSNLRLQRQKG